MIAVCCPIDRTGELLQAPPSFMLVVSYNPGYQNFLKGMKPSTRQRFVSLRFDFPAAAQEEAILIGETGCSKDVAQKVVAIGQQLRALKDVDLEEVASTRLLVYAATLINDGMDPVGACKAALVEGLTDDAEIADALLGSHPRRIRQISESQANAFRRPPHPSALSSLPG